MSKFSGTNSNISKACSARGCGLCGCGLSGFGFFGFGLAGVVEAAEEEGGVGDVLQGFGPVVELRLQVLLRDPVAAHRPQRQDVLAHEVEVLARAPQLVAFFGQDGVAAGPFGMLIFLCS